MKPLNNQEKRNLAVLKEFGFCLKIQQTNNIRNPYQVHAISEELKMEVDLNQKIDLMTYKSIEIQWKALQIKKYGKQLEIDTIAM